MRRRLLSLLLAVVMVLGMLPTTVLAEETSLSVTLDGQTLSVMDMGSTYPDQLFNTGEVPWYQVTVPYGTAEGTALNMTYNGTAVSGLYAVNNTGMWEGTPYYPTDYYGEFYACEISGGFVTTVYCVVTLVEDVAPPNTAPALAGDAAATATVTVGTAYELDLASVFTDADNDTLTYTVSVNDGEAAATASSYSYTPAEAGETTLVFVANDGTADSPSYTVTLTAEAQAVEEASCLSVLENAPTSGTITEGETFSVNLSEIYADSESHTVTYGFETTVNNENTKIQDGVFYFSAEAGSYEVTLTAKCDAMEVSHTLTITVEAQAEEEASCLSVAENASTGGKIEAGALYSLTLSEVFSDSEGHSLTYDFVSEVENQHTKIEDGVFYFSAAAGTYAVTLTAKCESMEVSHTISITVEAGNAGIAAQYNYNETDADSVTVYVTLSNDGYPVAAQDGTPISHLEVTVPYFDLGLYGLEDYYRYGTDGGSGVYTGETVIKRPTGLHLYIYLLERYYMGMDEAECGKGTSDVLSHAAETDVLYMDDGSTAYSSNGKQALLTSGGPTSLYMVNFWGHDENLMYFRNHCYPYMSAGWGATSDYILLSDGDTWDVGMFSNWEFHNYGYFAKFEQDAYTATAGESVTVKTQKWGTTSSAVAFDDVSGLNVGLYSDEWELLSEIAYAAEGGSSLTFTAPETAGTYYLMALDPSAKDANDACIAPATAILTVTGNVECDTCTDENSDRICDVCGAVLNNLPTLAEGVENRTVTIQTGLSYQVDDLVNGNIFTDADGDSLTYSYRKSSDGGETWGDWTAFGEALEHGGVNKSLVNSVAGTYTYEFKANDGYADSEARWTLTLATLDVVPANINFYVGRDQNYSTNGSIYPTLELYRTAGIDENQFDYVGWFTNAEGKTEYVYDPQDYTIIDGETDYVVIDEVQYELHDYEKIVFTDSLFGAEPAEGETATASGTVVGNYNMYYATITTGRYSTRAYGYNTATSAYDVYLGGQSMELPMEVDIYGNGGGDIYLRVVSVRTTSKKLDNTYFTADDYYAEMIMPVTGSMIHSGDAYVSGNYTYFPFMSYAAGNASLYNIYVYPYDTENYIFNQSINNTTSKGYTVTTKSVSISTIMLLTVNVPQNADFGLYFQYNNFNTKEVEPLGEAVSNSDGTKTLTYKVSKSNANYTWRLSDPSGTYVTKAGWLAGLSAATEKTITFSEYTNKASHDYSMLGTAVKTRDEGDVQVFLSDSGFKSVSGTQRVRAYRMWELINSDTANIIVEPDFNIQVLQGNAADVSLLNGGNAVNNWIDVNPTTTDIIAVNYDSIDMYSTADNYGSHGGLFPATNPERTGVFVITNQTAGTADAHISFNGSKDTDRGTQWDYNYDTWYYLNTDTAPTMDFTVTGTGDVAVSYATVITNDALKSTLSDWTSLTADAEGKYTADLLSFRNAGTKGGTVIIRMTDSTGTSYRLARVAEMTATVTNVTTPGEPFMPGNDVSITFDGLFRSVNKIAGIFNPTTYYLRYTTGETEFDGKLAQYQQMDKTTITLTIPEDITFPEGQTKMDYSFTNGYIYGSMYAASSPFQSMYYITDTGVGTNFSAVNVSFVLSRLADIPLEVEQTVYYDVKLNITDGENTLSGYTLTLTDSEGNVLTPDENGVYQDLLYGDYGCDISLAGYKHNIAALHLGSDDEANVAEGILTKTIVLEKAAEGAWDGVTATEPAADENGVYQIGTGAELAWLAQTVNAGTTGVSAVLTADIDLAEYDWTPIGNSTYAFGGSFDGQNHKITGLYIYSITGATYQGLFGHAAAGTTIKNLSVDGSISLTSPDSVSAVYAGGVVGRSTGVTMDNVHSNVDVTITRVKGNWSGVGGLIGSSSGGGTITNSSNSGNITGYNSVAGIVSGSVGSISNCYNSGNISGYQYVAGIASNYTNVTSCYNTGNITGTGSYVGGIIPQLATYTLTNCFNTGTVTAANNYGALVGRLSSQLAVLTDNYYLKTSCIAGIGANGTDQHIALPVSAETMASRDFVKTMNTGLATPAYAVGTDHPILTWQDPNAEVIAPVLVSQLTLDAETLTVYLGETGQLTATVNEDAENQTLTWTSSDTTIAAVDETGLITPVAAGTATITVSATDGSGKTATCTVTVAEKSAVEVVAGDFDGNGSVTMVDVNAAFNAYMNEDDLTDAQKAAVDTNGNGIVDMAEVNAIFNIYMNE